MISIAVDISGSTGSGTFEAKLECVADTFCDPSFRTPNNLGPVGPEYLDNFEGDCSGNAVTQEWYVPVKNYILTKVELFKGGGDTAVSGFEVTFAPDNDDLINWPEVKYLFGNKDLTENTESKEFTIDGELQEIKDIEYCIDGLGSNGVDGDLEGFRFTLFSGDTI